MADGRQLAPAHLAAEQRRVRRPEVTPIAEGEPARTFQPISIFRLFAVTCRDDEAVFVIGDREVAMHLLDLRDRKTGLGKDALPIALAKLALAEIAFLQPSARLS